MCIRDSEHTDHISGLRVLLKKLRIPLYATAEVLERLRWDGVIAPDQEAFTVEAGRPFSVGSLVIDGFDTPHDSVHSVGYRVQTPDGRRVAVATDMGYISDGVDVYKRQCWCSAARRLKAAKSQCVTAAMARRRRCCWRTLWRR